MDKSKKITFLFMMIPFMLTACMNDDMYNENIRPSEIRESQTTNEVALTNLNLGIAYLKEGDYNKALEKIKRSLSADPNYGPTYNVLGLLYQGLGDYNKAEKNFKKAISINNLDSSSLNNYGNFLCTQNRLDEAEKVFLKAAKNPLYESPETALTNAGQCLYQNGQIENSKEYFREALQLNPTITQALIKMSEINFNEKEYLSARAYLQRYEEIAPHNAKTLLLGIKIENNLGDQDAASSYDLLLKNSFPDSDEVASLKNTSTVKKKEVVEKNNLENKDLITKKTNLNVNPKRTESTDTSSDNVNPKRTESTDTSSDKDAIQISINKWINAWSSQDVDGYLASYADEFIPSKGLSKKKWERERANRLLAPGYIKVTLSGLKIDMRGENYAKVSFMQKYQSDTYKDRMKKELLLQKINEVWLIVQEQKELYSKNVNPKRTESTDTSSDKDAIQISINKWINAWSSQDVDGYLASYADEFIPSKGLSKKKWERERANRLLAPGYIKVTLSGLKIDMRGENYAKVSFMQKYQSDTYKDRMKKELLLQKINEVWLIIKEN